VTLTGDNVKTYGYDSRNQRILRSTSTSFYCSLTVTLDLYGVDGKKLEEVSVATANYSGTCGVESTTVLQTNVWFGGRLLVPHDRLSSNGKYFPYGEDRTNPSPANPANGVEKFATYTRDSSTGLDYAYQRYYTSGLGRFLTADPLGRSASSYSPQSWNRYTYAGDDPANNSDPSGEDTIPCKPSGLTIIQHDSCMPTGIEGNSTVSLDGAGGGDVPSVLQGSAQSTAGLSRYLTIISGAPDPAFPSQTQPDGTIVINVGCQGDSDLENLECAPAADSQRYFAAGAKPYYSGPLAQVFWANQQLWSSTADVGTALVVATAAVSTGGLLAGAEAPSLLGPAVGRLLWSGPGNAILAGQAASVSYGTTLGGTLVGMGISTLQGLGFPTYGLWQAASAAFAAGASGTVTAFAGDASATSIFVQTELPILLSNGNPIIWR
jgi:RHS repeat-associated protein